MSAFEVTQPHTDEEFAAYYDLRWRVLRAPWDKPRGTERDNLEDAAHHAMAVEANSDRILGVGRLQMNTTSEAQLRYLAVDPEIQRRGVGRALVEYFEQLARELRAEQLVLNSRDTAVGFYEQLGFERVGEGPLVFGILRHIAMSKRLR